jgi:hypothetical protein
VLVVAAGAAILTYRATTAVAVYTGVTDPATAPIVSAVIDGGLVVVGVTWWMRSDTGAPALLEGTLALGMLTLSVVIQYQDALIHGARVLGRIIACVPPLVLFATSKVLLRENVRARELLERERARAVRRSDRQPSASLSATPSASRNGAVGATPSSRVAALHSVEASASERNRLTRKAQVDALMRQSDGRLSGAKLAEALGVSGARGRALAAEWRKGQAAVS